MRLLCVLIAFLCFRAPDPVEKASDIEAQSVLVPHMAGSTSLQARLEPLSKLGKDICTQAGHTILRDVPEAFSVRQQSDLAAGLIVQLDQDKASSRFDIGLGILQCDRYRSASCMLYTES